MLSPYSKISRMLLVNFKKVNFFYELATVSILILASFIVAICFLYVTSNAPTQQKIIRNIVYLFLVAFVFIGVALVQTWINGKIYIYHLELVGDLVVIKWQDGFNLFEANVELCKIDVKLIPSGRNNPYLLFAIIDNERIINVKQTYFSTWNKNFMQQVFQYFKNLTFHQKLE
jgi:hypothetical protein